MRLLIFSSLLFIQFNIANGQTSDKDLEIVVNNYVKELMSKKIDTICIYQDYCVGCLYIWSKKEDKCNFEGLFISQYILWSEDGQTFMTKKDNCFDYSMTKILNDSIWVFFFENQDALIKEDLKAPEYVIINDGKEEVHCSWVNHSFYHRIKIIISQRTIIEKDIDDYYLTKFLNSSQKNINYEYNINSSVMKFQMLIDRDIKSATEKTTLIKTLR